MNALGVGWWRVIEIMSHEVLEANRLSHLRDSQKTCRLSGGIDEVFKLIFFYFILLYINDSCVP